MAHGIWIFLILLIGTHAASLQRDVTNTTDYDYEDDYYDYLEPLDDLHEDDSTTITPKTSKKVQKEVTDIQEPQKVERDREELTTKKPFSKYEVTELVDDLPDLSTKRVPILTNFTITRPLNLAGNASNKIDNVSTNIKDEGDEILNTIFVPIEPKVSTKIPDKAVKDRVDRKYNFNKEEKNYFDNFDHIDDFEKEFGDDDDEDDDEDDFEDSEKKKEISKNKNFRDYFHDVKKSIVSGFKSVVNKHKDGINDSLHKIVNSPISFFSKLHKKSSDLAKKIHKAVSRRKYHDDDDYFHPDDDDDGDHFDDYDEDC